MALVKAFRCSHSGLYYPADYIKEWGRKYGIGLGSTPVSEVHDTNYQQPAVVDNTGSFMHPTGVTKAQLDFVEVDEKEYKENLAVLQIEDPQFTKRAEIIKTKQSVSSKARLPRN
jgi:hypothetical protein